MTASYLDHSLRAFLDSVATREPAPGGGAVAAVTVSLAASLVAMAARYSTTRVEDGQGLVILAEGLRLRAAGLADADADAFGAVIAAYARARELDDEVAGQEGIRAAMTLATQVPLEVAEIGAETAGLAARLASEGKPDLRGDAIAALLLAVAATRSAAELVSINVSAVGGDEVLADRAAVAVATAQEAAASVH